MVALTDILPKAKSSVTSNYDHSNDPWFKSRYSLSESEESEAPISKAKPVPPYLKRAGFKPSKPEDFGDGGAFPEIHYAQYPLGMGRSTKQKPGGKTLPLTVDEQGNLRYDAVVRQNENSKKIVYSQHTDLVPIFAKDAEKEDDMDVDEKQKEIDETTQETRSALEKIVNVRLSAAQPKNVPKQSSDSKFIKYKPSQQSAAFNSGAKERIIRMVEMPVDPMEPPKFKHKRVPKASGSPPVPVMHSPPRPVTVKDQQDWKIPPCISNWKNPKGYTIPLDKRLAADGRGLQEVQINDNFAKLSEALYVAEQKAREAVAVRSKVQKEMMMKEKEKKEMELRELARQARKERTGVATATAVTVPPSERGGGMDDSDMRMNYERPRDVHPKESKEEREERLQREKIREERRKERERERRLEAKDAAMGKKSKITRDRDRDISEKVALGMASTGARGGEVMYDQRLFNQEKGMDSGFATDDAYNIYDKGLFNSQPTLSTLYRPKKDADDEMYGGADEQMEKLMKTDRFKADKQFAGTSERTGPRDRPMEFEKDQPAEEDPFGLDQFLTEVKTGKKAMDKVGSGGTLKASAGSMRDGFEGSGRSRIGFERGR
ncbi:SNW/SKI-interacting protein A [Andrographis paniculata]|uniref:SNW/SKI-interacting protein A n=1 Tax=Andrographis paniculata TaxID=175694 RepID=UPI0021E846E8|nr:SNW/SKI-interacting protein A [Andrographis paniculata]XP_051143076.1 SNW/SKI-interacting protein A [Andrographis paniculata]XP_051143077.1 SNW/SKI-interacting protein A [Andrographis paniculata]